MIKAPSIAIFPLTLQSFTIRLEFFLLRCCRLVARDEIVICNLKRGGSREVLVAILLAMLLWFSEK